MFISFFLQKPTLCHIKSYLSSTNSTLTLLRYVRDEGTYIQAYHLCRIYEYHLGFQKADFKSRRMNNQDSKSTISASCTLDCILISVKTEHLIERRPSPCQRTSNISLLFRILPKCGRYLLTFSCLKWYTKYIFKGVFLIKPEEKNLLSLLHHTFTYLPFILSIPYKLGVL